MTARIPNLANLRLDDSVVVTETPLNGRNTRRQQAIHHRHDDGPRRYPDLDMLGGALFRANWILPIHHEPNLRLSAVFNWVEPRFKHLDKLNTKLHHDLLGAVAVIIECELYRGSQYTKFMDSPPKFGGENRPDVSLQNRIAGLEIIVASKVNARKLDHHAAGAENGMDGSVYELVKRKYPGLEKNKQVEVSIEQVGRWAGTSTVLDWVRRGGMPNPNDPIAELFSKIDSTIVGSMPLP